MSNFMVYENSHILCIILAEMPLHYKISYFSIRTPKKCYRFLGWGPGMHFLLIWYCKSNYTVLPKFRGGNAATEKQKMIHLIPPCSLLLKNVRNQLCKIFSKILWPRELKRFLAGSPLLLLYAIRTKD